MNEPEIVEQLKLNGSGTTLRGLSTMDILRLYCRCTCSVRNIENAPTGITVFTTYGRYIVKANEDGVLIEKRGNING